MTKSNRIAPELKLTAALYAKRKGVVELIRSTGKLPEKINTGGFHIGMNILIRKRGTDITLTDDEQLVLDAILREKRLPGGKVVLVDS
jgi:hypothetical protein